MSEAGPRLAPADPSVLRGVAEVKYVGLGIVKGVSHAYPDTEIHCTPKSLIISPGVFSSIFKKPGLWFHFQGTFGPINSPNGPQNPAESDQRIIVATRIRPVSKRHTRVRAEVGEILRNQAKLTCPSSVFGENNCVLLPRKMMKQGPDMDYICDLSKILRPKDQILVDVVDGIVTQGCAWIASRAWIADMACSEAQPGNGNNRYIGIVVEVISPSSSGNPSNHSQSARLYCKADFLFEDQDIVITNDESERPTFPTNTDTSKKQRITVHVNSRRYIQIGDRYELKFTLDPAVNKVVLTSAVYRFDLRLSVPHGMSTIDWQRGSGTNNAYRAASYDNSEPEKVHGVAQVTKVETGRVIGVCRRFPSRDIICKPKALNMTLAEFNSKFIVGNLFHFAALKHGNPNLGPNLLADKVHHCANMHTNVHARVTETRKSHAIVTLVSSKSEMLPKETAVLFGTILDTSLYPFFIDVSKILTPGDELSVDIVDGCRLLNCAWVANGAQFTTSIDERPDAQRSVGIVMEVSPVHTDTRRQQQRQQQQQQQQRQQQHDATDCRATIHCDTGLPGVPSIIHITTSLSFQKSHNSTQDPYFYIRSEGGFEPGDRFEIEYGLNPATRKWFLLSAVPNNSLRFTLPPDWFQINKPDYIEMKRWQTPAKEPSPSLNKQDQISQVNGIALTDGRSSTHSSSSSTISPQLPGTSNKDASTLHDSNVHSSAAHSAAGERHLETYRDNNNMTAATPPVDPYHSTSCLEPTMTQVNGLPSSNYGYHQAMTSSQSLQQTMQRTTCDNGNIIFDDASKQGPFLTSSNIESRLKNFIADVFAQTTAMQSAIPALALSQSFQPTTSQPTMQSPPLAPGSLEYHTSFDEASQYASCPTVGNIENGLNEFQSTLQPPQTTPLQCGILASGNECVTSLYGSSNQVPHPTVSCSDNAARNVKVCPGYQQPTTSNIEVGLNNFEVAPDYQVRSQQSQVHESCQTQSTPHHNPRVSVGIQKDADSLLKEEQKALVCSEVLKELLDDEEIWDLVSSKHTSVIKALLKLRRS